MKYGVLIFIAIVLLGGGFALFWWINAPVAGNVTEPSDASQRRLESTDSLGSTGRLQLSHLDAGSNVDADCYSFVIPFDARNIKNERRDTECTTRFDTVNPRGVVVIHVRENTTQAALDEVTSVTLREASESGYTRQELALESFQVPLRTYVSASEITSVFFYSRYIVTVAFSEFPQISDQVSAAHVSFLDSLVFHATLDQ